VASRFQAEGRLLRLRSTPARLLAAATHPDLHFHGAATSQCRDPPIRYAGIVEFDGAPNAGMDSIRFTSST
jgi:hypothetical protein